MEHEVTGTILDQEYKYTELSSSRALITYISCPTNNPRTSSNQPINHSIKTKMPNRQLGTVKSYDEEKGFGFITNEFGGELMIHQTIRPGGLERSPSLKEGMRVSYEAVHHGHRNLVADQVRVQPDL
ncbi:hypothetical protein BDW59DRAFT_137763 [Aspergillus cavernicola]|uniref:CSD domain-containing protein n=1 Tax=Aspergillus cavernicola TaxID=176166 RepID=A0ABR4J2U3_9EURO